jgi:AcrR family transcriptional regulator
MTVKHLHTDVRRAQIIEAARRLVIRHGSEHVTVRRIAQEVGFSEAAVYRHFASKKDVLLLLLENIEEGLLEDLRVEVKGAYSPLEILALKLQRHLSAVEQRRGLTFLVIAEIISLGDKKLNQRTAVIIARYVDYLRGQLAEAVEAGEVRAGLDLEAAATLIFGLVQGLVNIWAINGYVFDLKERFQALWAVYLRSIRG